MSDVQVAVWLRRETGVYGFVDALCQIFIYHLFYKVFADYFGFHNFLLVYRCFCMLLVIGKIIS